MRPRTKPDNTQNQRHEDGDIKQCVGRKFVPSNMGQATVTFKCLLPDDPAVAAYLLQQAPNVIIEQRNPAASHQSLRRSAPVAVGVDDIITVLTTDASEWQQRPSLRLDDHQTTDPLTWLLIAGLIALVTLLIVSPGFRWFFLNVVLNVLLNSGRGGFSSGRLPGGGGFSGGGGSSGGGGASGRW